MGTKVAVAFLVIFMAHMEKQRLAASPQNLSSGRDLSMSFVTSHMKTFRTVTVQMLNGMASERVTNG